MTRIYLVFHGRFPSEKAASLFAAKSAEAFMAEGATVTLLVPTRRGTGGDARAFYGLSRDLEVIYLPTIDLFSWPVPRALAFRLSYAAFARSVRAYLAAHAQPDDIIYSNETLPLDAVADRFPRTVYEMHDFPEGKQGFYRRFLNRIGKLIIHNRWKTEEAVKRFGLDGARILTEPNAVDIAAFDPQETRGEARAALGLPADARIVAYTGHLYGWKGVDTLAEAAKRMPETQFVFVGGTPGDVAAYRAKHNAPNMQWLGFRPHAEIPLWQRAADVLVLPNTAKEPISAYYTSPMKLFEYMASGTPVVASRIPSVEELVDETQVRFATADDPVSFKEAIEDVLAHADIAAARVAAGKRFAAAHTWQARAERILAFVAR